MNVEKYRMWIVLHVHCIQIFVMNSSVTHLLEQTIIRLFLFIILSLHFSN